jgi:hypothetical protein
VLTAEGQCYLHTVGNASQQEYLDIRMCVRMAIHNVITYGSHVPNTDEALIEKTDVSVHEFLNSADYNAAQKFLYDERVSFNDIDNIIAADDSFRYSEEIQ